MAEHGRREAEDGSSNGPPGEAPAEAPISRLLAEVIAHCPGQQVTLGALAAALGDRAFGLLILVLCPLSLLPFSAALLGLPILILGVQMAAGLRRPSLPNIVARIGIPRIRIEAASERVAGLLARLERHVHPRSGPFLTPGWERVAACWWPMRRSC